MGIYNNCRASLLKYCKDFISKNSLTGYQVFDFDTHASLHDLPDTNLIGIAELSLDNAGHTYNAYCMIGIATKANDTYLEELLPAIDKMYDELRPDYILSIIDAADENVQRGNLKVIDSVELMPVARTNSRPVQFIAVPFALMFPGQ